MPREAEGDRDGELHGTGGEYSVELRAAGGIGPVTWSIGAGMLPPGLELDEATGVIEGVPEPGFTPPWVQVQATDGQSTASRLLAFVKVAGVAPPMSTGATLPEGGAVTLTALGFTWIGTAHADGAFEPITTASPFSIAAFQEYVATPDGRYGVIFLHSEHPIVEMDTGELVEPAEPFPAGTMGIAISPDGQWMAWRDPFGASLRFIDTATWSVHRVATGLGTSPPGGIVWSADSSEVAVMSRGAGADVMVLSVAEPADDRSIAVGGSEDCDLGSWSATDRVAFLCPTVGVVTVHSSGNDERVIGPAPACPDPEVPACELIPDPLVPRFSPSGTYVVAAGAEPSQLVVLEDAEGAEPLYLNDPWPYHVRPFAGR